jgi:hypothetical protein
MLTEGTKWNEQRKRFWHRNYAEELPQGSSGGRQFYMRALLLLVVPALLSQPGCREQMQGQGATVPALKTDMTPSDAELDRALAAEPGQPPAVRKGPTLAFEKSVYDFGQVGPGTSHTGRLEFVNSGSNRLEVTEVKGCCGVLPKLADNKKQYGPGERGTLELQYSAASRPEPVVRQIYVSSNDPAHRRMELTIKANIVSKVACEPATVQLSLVEEHAVPSTLTLTSTDGRPFSIASITSANRCITARVDPAVKATTFVVPLEVDADKLAGRTSGLIGVVLTHPECSRLMIPFTVRQKYRAVPSQFVLLNTVPQQAVERNLSIVSEVDTDFTIDSIDSERNLIKVTSQEKITKGYRLGVVITPPAVRGEGGSSVYRDVLLVHVGPHVVTVDVRGIYARPLAQSAAAEGRQ